MRVYSVHNLDLESPSIPYTTQVGIFIICAQHIVFQPPIPPYILNKAFTSYIYLPTQPRTHPYAYENSYKTHKSSSLMYIFALFCKKNFHICSSLANNEIEISKWKNKKKLEKIKRGLLLFANRVSAYVCITLYIAMAVDGFSYDILF